MLLVKIALAPLAFLAAMFFLMASHIVGTSYYREANWQPTMVTVVKAATQCALTYQPEGKILREVIAVDACDKIASMRLPTTGRKPKVEMGLYGELAYQAHGKAVRWQGKLSDAGVYNATAGQTVDLVYNPTDPRQLDTVARKGFLGGLSIVFGSLAFLAFYVWLLWPRRKNPPRGGIPTRAVRGPVERGRQRFGRA